MKFYLYQMQWYRRWRGGAWYYVSPIPFPYLEFWMPTKPNPIERILRREVWFDGVNMGCIVRKYKEEKREETGGDWDEFISGE